MSRRIRKNIPLEDVITLYRDNGWTAHQLAEKYDVWPQTIFRWLKDAGIKRRPTGRKSPTIDPKLLEELYYQKRYTLMDIAKTLNTSDKTVLTWFRKFGIPRRPRGHWSKREQIP